MTNSWRCVSSRSLLLAACVACACDDPGGGSEASGSTSSTGGDSTTGGESTDTGIATTPPGSTDTGIATTPPESTDTGIATTPPETDGSSSESGDGSTTGFEGIEVQVSYSFTAEVAGVPLDCASVGASWVDVVVVDQADPDDKSFDRVDVDCDDEAISVGPLPVGTYVLEVSAWDQSLWVGESELFEIDGSELLVEALIPLTEVPTP